MCTTKQIIHGNPTSTAGLLQLGKSDMLKKAMKRIVLIANQPEEEILNNLSSVSLGEDVVVRAQEKRRVSFAKAVVCHVVASRHSYSKQEIEAAWWQRDEYENISRSWSKQILMLDRGEILRGKKYCTRGLESHTRIGMCTKDKVQSASIEAVLQEQEQQIEDQLAKGEFTRELDDESVYLIYNDITSSCQMWATAVGLRDQRVAEALVDELDDYELDDYREEEQPKRRVKVSVTPLDQRVSATFDLPCGKQLQPLARAA